MAMTEDEVFQRIRKILANKLKLKEEQITNNSRLADDLGVDSVDFWEIIAKVEKEFGLDVDDKEAKNANTVQDVISILKEKLETK